MKLVICVFFFFSRYQLISFFFFFSSRRRHTRFSRDWSSDVCSSDLLRPGEPPRVRLRGPDGAELGLALEQRHVLHPARDARRDGLHHGSGKRGALGQRAVLPQGGARGGGRAEEPGAGHARVAEEGRRSLRHLLHALPRCLGQGRRAGLPQVRAAAGPDQRRSAEGADRRLLAELRERGRCRDALLRGGLVAGRALGRRELLEDLGQAMSTMTTAGSSKGSQAVLGVLVLAGAAAFVYGIMQPQSVRTWAIYLVNLLFWSSLAITGPRSEEHTSELQSRENLVCRLLLE